MPLSAFDNKDCQPTESDLKDSLAETYSLWAELRDKIIATYSPMKETWHFSGKSTGWGMRLVQKDRVIVYMTPCRGYFLFSIVLGEKAVARARTLKLPAAVMKPIDSARKYAEGYGIRFEIRKAADVNGIASLVRLKLE